MAWFTKKAQIAWSGPADGEGPSYSGAEAMASGLLPLHKLVAWLKARPEMKGKGIISAKRVKAALIEDELHHWRDKRGTVKLIGYYIPEKALKEILDLEEYF